MEKKGRVLPAGGHHRQIYGEGKKENAVARAVRGKPRGVPED